jgi:ribosomal protein L16 Arg81 hydroxylase
VINSAGGFIPELAMICYDIVKTIMLPVAVNMYLTNRGQKTSAPPHTDKQDVFVLQTSGYKHWKVYKPPIPSYMLRADPYARGKMKDVLSLSELEQNPIIDVTLGPGQVLYVPAGYPHTTGKLTLIEE